MTPEVVFVLTIILAFSAVVGAYGMGKSWLFAWVVFGLVVSTITAGKVVDVFGIAITVAMPLYASLFLATDILTERYGKKASYEAVTMSFAALFGLVIFTQLALAIPSNVFTEEINEAMTLVFNMSLRVGIAAAISYLFAQLLDVWLYHYLRTKTGEKRLWLRNNVSTMTTQFLDNLLFFSIAFYGILPNWFEMVLVASVIRIFVSLLDTPFMYVTKAIIPRDQR